MYDRWPSGFRAPLGIIPGKDGAFESDLTAAITLRIPPEFVRECRSVQLSPEAVLRGFIGDLTGIQNYLHHPRTDGYGSNGSDERDYAEAWFNRAYEMSRVDLDLLDAKDEEQEERQNSYDELTGFLDDFLDCGGRTEDFLNAVQSIVDKQANAATD